MGILLFFSDHYDKTFFKTVFRHIFDVAQLKLF